MADRPRSAADIRAFASDIKSACLIPDYVFQILDVLEKNNCDKSATFNDIRVRKYDFIFAQR